MELQAKIESFVESALPSPDVFLVSVKVVVNAKASKVAVFLDGDNGVSIDQCASVSRQLGAYIEESELMDVAYRLEVSSPGADEPIMLLRQYPQHIGRKFAVSLKDGGELIGTLKSVEGNNLLFDQEVKVKGKKKPQIQEASIEFEQISESKIKLPF